LGADARHPAVRDKGETTAELIGLKETWDQSRQEGSRDFVLGDRVSNIGAKSSSFEATPIPAAPLDRDRRRVDEERDLGEAQDLGAPLTG